MPKHAYLATSASERWLKCPPSAKLCASINDSGSPYAQQGTDAHALCEYKVEKLLGRDPNDPTENLTYFDTEMADCTDEYASYVMEQVEALQVKYQKPAEPEPVELAPFKDEIEYEDFQKLDLRLGKVVACEEVKRSKKLLKLTVDLGSEQRTIVSGIKTWYQPEELVGKTVTVVANLKPVTLCGVESRGMILCASDPKDTELAFITPAKALPAGWVVR